MSKSKGKFFAERVNLLNRIVALKCSPKKHSKSMEIHDLEKYFKQDACSFGKDFFLFCSRKNQKRFHKKGIPVSSYTPVRYPSPFHRFHGNGSFFQERDTIIEYSRHPLPVNFWIKDFYTNMNNNYHFFYLGSPLDESLLVYLLYLKHFYLDYLS